jgi:hypothetical protein
MAQKRDPDEDKSDFEFLALNGKKVVMSVIYCNC